MKAELTREVAEKMYKSDDESVRAFALSNYPDLEVKALPKTWEELKHIDGSYISTGGNIYNDQYLETGDKNKNLFPTRELAEAALALAQLLQLRDRYNGDWKADWSDDDYKHTIYLNKNKISTSVTLSAPKVMSFKTKELRDQFLGNFRDLLEIAKPLL